jgi:hypothetical protein
VKKWRSGQIHRIFLLFYHVSIAGISNHPDTLLTRFWFDVYSPRYLHEQRVSDLRGADHFMQKVILCTTVFDFVILESGVKKRVT